MPTEYTSTVSIEIEHVSLRRGVRWIAKSAPSQIEFPVGSTNTYQGRRATRMYLNSLVLLSMRRIEHSNFSTLVPIVAHCFS